MENGKVDWELKERRIAWESITKSLAEVQSALINSGNIKFNSLSDAMEDLSRNRTIEFNLFLDIDSKPKSDEPEKRYICEKCDTKITQGVSDWSLKEYGRALCMKCQGKQKK